MYPTIIVYYINIYNKFQITKYIWSENGSDTSGKIISIFIFYFSDRNTDRIRNLLIKKYLSS